MFGNVIKSFKGGSLGAKAIQVLAKTYGLQVSHSSHVDMMKRIAQSYGQIYNEHEMAVHFLAEFSNTIKLDHPQAISEVTKYIIIAKGAYERDFITITPLEQLLEVAQERFKINTNDINAV